MDGNASAVLKIRESFVRSAAQRNLSGFLNINVPIADGNQMIRCLHLNFAKNAVPHFTANLLPNLLIQFMRKDKNNGQDLL